jgi:membrane peptidoglycan carboxypeptidase
MKRAVSLAIGAIAVLLGIGLVLGMLGFLGGMRRAPRIVAEAEAYERKGAGIERIPPEWKRILLVVEDPSFYHHRGIDVTTPGGGATTITQALAKRYCFDRFRPGVIAKLRQSLCALGLDRRVPKDEQLTLLLNVASLGPGKDGWVEGFDAGAREYFGKPLAEISTAEWTTLVAMLIGPTTYHPIDGRAALDERVRRIRRLVAGECRPTGARDVLLEGCR